MVYDGQKYDRYFQAQTVWEPQASLHGLPRMNSSITTSPPVPFPSTWASVHFDLLRGLAAFFVLFEHWRNLFFVDYPHITAYRLPFAVFYAIASAGHQSVILFFVLSGYFIGGTVFRSVERNQWAWSSYLLRRLVRLWTVLVPALLLCLFWDRLGIHLRLAPALYTGHVADNMVGDVAPALTARVFFGNLFFLQSILTSVFGSNGALWSLANEFWYYLLFPLGLIALWRTRRPLYRLLCAVLFVITAWFIGRAMFLAFPVWLAGVALFKLPPPAFSPRTARYLRVGSSLLYIPIFFAFGRLPWIAGNNRDYLLTVITTLFLWILLSANTPHTSRSRAVRASREFARFSYTLYVAHVPFLVFLTALIVVDSRWYPNTRTLTLSLGTLLAALIYSWVLAFLTEFRTDTVRQRLEHLFGLATLPSPLPSNPLAESPGPHVPKAQPDISSPAR
ncbi:MAG TPA: acyltransferase [Acidobacteriaceae bacterium]|nr:acyltransferase [Acidobacteriaceae bacterium]